MTNQSNPTDQVSRYRSFTDCRKVLGQKPAYCIGKLFWVLFHSLLVGVALFGIKISPQYQWLWVSISTKSLTLHYSGQAMHPHHNRDGEHVYMRWAETFNISNSSKKKVKWSPYCSHGLYVLNSNSPAPTWSAGMLHALAHAQNKSNLEIWVASSSHLYLACLIVVYKLYVATYLAWFYMAKRKVFWST